MNHGSLFSGIGGFDLAAQWMGWNNLFHCEWNENNKKILSKNFPESITYGDIKATDFTIHRGTIDILTGGFPCQPYSQAGKRKGKEDDRHLWPEMLRAIREIQPAWVVGENVLGIVNWSGGLVFDEVQADLEAEGYEVQPFILPACSQNAIHRRDRVWFIAYSDLCANRNFRKQDRETDGLQELDREAIHPREPIGANAGVSMHPDHAEQQGECTGQKRKREPDRSDSRDYGRTIWTSGIPESPICRKDDGVSRKLDEARLFALGNAIVPQVAYQIFKAIEAYETILK